jgi:hypothetical protein
LRGEDDVSGLLPPEGGVPDAVGTPPSGGSGSVRSGRCHFRLPSINLRNQELLDVYTKLWDIARRDAGKVIRLVLAD